MKPPRVKSNFWSAVWRNRGWLARCICAMFVMAPLLVIEGVIALSVDVTGRLLNGWMGFAEKVSARVDSWVGKPVEETP